MFRDYDEGDKVEDDFLQYFLPQERRCQAQIIVSKAPCGSCSAFAQRVMSRLEIEFDFKVIEVRKGS
jgi:hypothetical protein